MNDASQKTIASPENPSAPAAKPSANFEIAKQLLVAGLKFYAIVEPEKELPPSAAYPAIVDTLTEILDCVDIVLPILLKKIVANLPPK